MSLDDAIPGPAIPGNVRMAARSAQPVQLSREPDFLLGPLRVAPSLGEVGTAPEVRRLEPRIMQVLVALAREDGSTVSRADLIRDCWSGVAVGKDAINRVISKLRRLGEALDDPFTIQTLPRIGYRLARQGGASRGAVSTGADVASVAIAQDRAGERLVAVLPFESEGGAGAISLADGVSDAILSALTLNGGMPVAARHSSFQFRGDAKRQAAAALRASHLVDGSVSVEGDFFRVTAYLVDAASNRTLWSGRFDSPRSDIFLVQDRIAEQVAVSLQVQLRPRPPAGPIDPVIHDLYSRAMLALEQPVRGQTEQALAYFKEVVAGLPGFSLGWAGLAEAQRLRMLYLPPASQLAVREASRRSARRALELDPSLGQAFGTLANLIPRFNRWAEVEDLFERGLAATPENPLLRRQHARFLISAGLTRRGLDELLVVQRINPLSAAVAIDVAAALFDVGKIDDALASIDRAYSLWPSIVLVWSECVRLRVLVGDYDIVATLLDAPPPMVAPGDVNIARRKLHMIARRDGDAATREAARRNFEAFSETGVAPGMVAIHALTTINEVGAALAIADQLFRVDARQSDRAGINMMGTYTLAGEADSSVLFRADTMPIRSMPAFQTILERIGLDAYWRGRDVIPDFRLKWTS